jgi:hypothetical protein
MFEPRQDGVTYDMEGAFVCLASVNAVTQRSKKRDSVRRSSKQKRYNIIVSKCLDDVGEEICLYCVNILSFESSRRKTHVCHANQ